MLRQRQFVAFILQTCDQYGNVIIDLGKAEGVIKKDELIPRMRSFNLKLLHWF